MRLRLGLLQDPAALERQAQREFKEATAKKAKAETPTVKTEEQTKIDEAAATKEKERIREKVKKSHEPRIRPLSEARAIDTGAEFASEAFIFSIALGLLVVERLYSRAKENSKRSDVADKFAELEARDAEHTKTIEAMRKELDDLRAQRASSWLWGKKQEQKPEPEPEPDPNPEPTSGKSRSEEKNSGNITIPQASSAVPSNTAKTLQRVSPGET